MNTLNHNHENHGDINKNFRKKENVRKERQRDGLIWQKLDGTEGDDRIYIYDLINKNLILPVKKQTWYGWIDVADYEQLHFYPELNSIA